VTRTIERATTRRRFVQGLAADGVPGMSFHGIAPRHGVSLR